MRLIDADALCYEVVKVGDVEFINRTTKLIKDAPTIDNDIIGKLKTAIENKEICKNCPTAERITGENLLGAMALGFSYGMEADRPQGEWISKDGVFYCSCCGNDSAGLSEDDVYVYEVPLPNYCQDCGAHMKGVNSDI